MGGDRPRREAAIGRRPLRSLFVLDAAQAEITAGCPAEECFELVEREAARWRVRYERTGPVTFQLGHSGPGLPPVLQGEVVGGSVRVHAEWSPGAVALPVVTGVALLLVPLVVVAALRGEAEVLPVALLLPIVLVLRWYEQARMRRYAALVRRAVGAR